MDHALSKILCDSKKDRGHKFNVLVGSENNVVVFVTKKTTIQQMKLLHPRKLC